VQSLKSLNDEEDRHQVLDALAQYLTTLTLAASNAVTAQPIRHLHRQALLVSPATGKWWPSTTSVKPIQIWHTLNSVRYNDVTKTANASGKVAFTRKWAPAGKRLYYATFSDDTW